VCVVVTSGLILTVVSVRIVAVQGVEQGRAPASAAGRRVDDILRAACRVVVRDGASHLRIGTVAREAGVSRTLVHYYFTTRQELLRAAFAFAEDERASALEAELAGLETGAARAERALLRAIEPELEETPALWNEVWSGLRYDADLRPLVQERYREWAERIVALLEEGRADGSVSRRVDAREAGWRLAATADGLDSILYLGLLERPAAAELLASAVRAELVS
jgi:AcrR family transcriptional regulator